MLLLEGIKVLAHVAEAVAEEFVFLGRRERLVFQAGKLLFIMLCCLVGIKLFHPLGPEFLGGSVSGVGALVGGEAEEELGIDIERANAVRLLVAQVLGDGLLERVLHVRALALDDAQRDAVYEEHEVWPVVLLARAAHDAELFSHVKNVVVRVGPVDVLEREALLVAVDALFEGLAQGEQVIDRFAGIDVALIHG